MGVFEIVKEYIVKQNIIQAGDRIVIGFSGGPDSVCLTDILLRLRDEYGLFLAAVHVNHGLRKEAGEDEQFVRDFCSRSDIPLDVVHADVAALARRQRLSEEEAGRNLRRQSLETAGVKYRCRRIALGHHASDNAETMLLNLARGTSLKGLGGMAPVSGRYLRPLLCVTRPEIDRYLQERGLSFCTDRTNAGDDYTRNRIRHHVLGYLNEHVNSRSTQHISQTMEYLRAVNQFLTEQQRQWRQRFSDGPGYVTIPEEVYRQIPAVLQSAVIHQTLCESAGSEKDITAAHVAAVQDLFDRQTGRILMLPYGMTARRIYEGVKLMPAGSGSGTVPEAADFSCRRFPAAGNWQDFPTSGYTKWFDYDIIKNGIDVRHRRPGDYIAVNAGGQKKSLKKFFVDEKIPGELRGSIWLVCDGSQVMWVVGYRQNPLYQVDEHTEEIIEIKFKGDLTENGRN